MAKPTVRCATMPNGDIEATCLPKGYPFPVFLICDKRTGNVIESSVVEGTDIFRWLVNEARKRGTIPASHCDAMPDDGHQ